MASSMFEKPRPLPTTRNSVCPTFKTPSVAKLELALMHHSLPTAALTPDPFSLPLENLRRLCGHRFDDRTFPCGVRGADRLDAASPDYRLRLCRHDPRNGELAQRARSAIHARATPVDIRSRLDGLMGNRAGATQHRTARRRDTVPHRVALDIGGCGSDHLLPSHPPAQVEQERVEFRDLVLASPLAAAGAFLAGLAIGGFWGMGPNFGQRIGLDVGGISAFMAAVLGGTLALQWPLGWLSDRVSRNLVIAGAALASAAAAVGVAMAAEAPLPLLLAAGALFGGFGIPIYSLCLAVANDDLPASRLLGTARGLLLLNGIGTAAGPLIGGAAMAIVGPGGLFLYAAALLIILAVLAVTRRQPSPQTRPRPAPVVRARR
ncbi:MFS transporter [Paracoccus sp. (in: a-proteobacteria)]|uniref:MFS transporter n=1 Tax=Paracoccus sp. TaxID=267 RepID=UPI002AFE1534|nr:MFS transporter [Paracoccus sp. (in: a-proteobacteria)]